MALTGFGYGKYEHGAFEAYKAKVVAVAAKQEAENKAKIKEQALINKGISNEYETKLAAIKSYYGGLHNSSSGPMPSLSNPSAGANGSPSDQLLACAYTTQQLVSLQDWIKQQAGL
jgi:hypothetical protein